MVYENISQLTEYLDFIKLDKSPKTFLAYALSARKLIDYFSINDFASIEKITASDLRKFQSDLIKSGVAKSSANSYFRPLKAMFNFFVEQEYLKESPFSKIKLFKDDSKEGTLFSAEEEEKFLSACEKPEELAMFLIYFTTGIRENELALLKTENINGYTIYLTNTKSNKDRFAYLPQFVYDALQEYLEYRNKKFGTENPYLFVSKMRTHYAGTSILSKFKAIMKRAKFSDKRIAELHVHSIRHTFCTNMAEKGVSLKIVQSMMGHSDSQTTMKWYSHARDSAIESAMRNQERIV